MLFKYNEYLYIGFTPSLSKGERAENGYSLFIFSRHITSKQCRGNQKHPGVAVPLSFGEGWVEA